MWASWYWYASGDYEAFFRGGGVSAVDRFGSAYTSTTGALTPKTLTPPTFMTRPASPTLSGTFFHDACVLKVDVFVAGAAQRTVFAMGDFVDLRQVLLRGDGVRVHVLRVEIFNVDHVLRVEQGGNCTLCLPRTRSCAETAAKSL